jgi:acyl-CoA thioester hydrolase
VSIFSLSLTVEESDLDELLHVNNAVYLQYAEQIARAHSDSLGLTLERMHELGGQFVVRRHDITYHLPCHLGDTLELRTHIVSQRGARAVRHVEIWRGAERIVDCETEWVWIDIHTSRPQRVPPDFNQMFGLSLAGTMSCNHEL